jgi:erythromycin esterase
MSDRHDSHARETGALVDEIVRCAEPLRGSDDLDALLDRIGPMRVVMLGEASHGTSEYYAWRLRLSRRLIREHGFSFIAVEGDWPDAYRVNRFVKGLDPVADTARDVLAGFRRWPTWMWANWEVVALAEWLRDHDRSLPEDQRVGFFGLDVYSLWASLGEVMAYLEATDPDALEAAHAAYACFEPFGRDVQAYARSTAFVNASCEDEVVALLAELRRQAGQGPDDDEARFDAEQNARAAVGAERYYRTMVRGGSESWNVRDRHMMGTLDDLLEHHGPDAKAIVWEHNTHVGDARATDMAAAGMVNTGQLARERYGEDAVALVGFGSHRGSVIAGRSWGAPMERMPVPEAEARSWEDVFHAAVGRDAWVLTSRLPAAARVPRGHRAIGVVYDPRSERYGNYVPTDLPRRYDAFVHVDESRALHPLHVPPSEAGPPDTYPWGV